MADAARAVVHGAVSLVNAIATGRGATLGIGLRVEATVKRSPGSGTRLHAQGKKGTLSTRLVDATLRAVVPKAELGSSRIDVEVRSEIPSGYGLKSSSAISSAVALACWRIWRGRPDHQKVLEAGVGASISSGVSITGAYDDACACYYGGFCVTDNRKMSLIRASRAPAGLAAAIFIPKKRKRGNPKKLRAFEPAFLRAWELARGGDWWNAMILNGVAASAHLNTDPGLIGRLVEKGALGVSVSGNGPAVAAVGKKASIARIRRAMLSSGAGSVIVSQASNERASVHDL